MSQRWKAGDGITNLIHIIPDKDVIGTIDPGPSLRVRLRPEQLGPPIPTGRIEEIDPRAASTPTPTFILSFATLRLDENFQLRSLFIYRVILRSLQVWIDNNDHLAGHC